MIKVYVTKDQDFEASRAKYISPTITVQDLLNCLCKEHYFPPHNATIHLGHDQMELSNKKATLKELGVHEGTFLTLSRSKDSIIWPAPINTRESVDRDDLDSNKANDDEDRSFGHQRSQDSDFGGNIQLVLSLIYLDFPGMDAHQGEGNVEMKGILNIINTSRL